MLIINNAAESRKLSEANDPTRNFMSEYFKKISTAIGQAVAKGQYQAYVVIPIPYTKEVTKLLELQGYVIATTPESPSFESFRLQISW